MRCFLKSNFVKGIKMTNARKIIMLKILLVLLTVCSSQVVARADLVMSFSNSSTIYNQISTINLVQGSTASQNQVYIWATDTDFATKSGLQAWALNINPAGLIANPGSDANLGFASGWTGTYKEYDSGTNIGYLETNLISGGIAADVNNRIYLGFFGLNANALGTANLSIEAVDPSLLWAYGNNVAGTPSRPTVNPLTQSLTVIVAVPEPTTLVLWGIASVIGGVGAYCKRLKRFNPAPKVLNREPIELS